MNACDIPRFLGVNKFAQALHRKLKKFENFRHSRSTSIKTRSRYGKFQTVTLSSSEATLTI